MAPGSLPRPDSAMHRAPLREKVVGHRTTMNTDHPIWVEVRRFGPKQWVVSLVCNGIAESTRTYSTRRDALAAFDAYGAMNRPGALATITKGRANV